MRFLKWHRRIVAALLAALSVCCFWAGLNRSAANQVATVVAKQQITPGQRISVDDLKIVHYPAELAVSDSFSNPQDLVGEISNTKLAPQQPITSHNLVSRGYAANPGEVMAGVGLLDPCLAEIITVGDKINLYTQAPDNSQRLIAEGIKVSGILPQSQNENSAKPVAKLLIISVSPKLAAQISALNETGALIITLS